MAAHARKRDERCPQPQTAPGIPDKPGTQLRITSLADRNHMRTAGQSSQPPVNRRQLGNHKRTAARERPARSIDGWSEGGGSGAGTKFGCVKATDEGYRTS